MNLHRLRLLAATGAAGLSLVASRAFGRAPMAGAQATSVRRMKLGSFEITVAFDWDHAKARAARLSIFDTVVKEGIPIAAVHLPFPGIGRLRKNGDAYIFDPAPWQLF